MPSQLELRYIVAFLAIAEELHFGRAATRLHLAQPTLSQQLQRLERKIGVELVSRTSREVQLTPAGQAFEREARLILEQANRAVSAARETAAGRTGTISIGFNFPAGQRVLEPTLRRMNTDFPGITTRLMEARTGPQLLALAEKKIDVGFVMATTLPEQVRSKHVLTEEIVAFVTPDHPLANRQVLHFKEVARHACVLFPRQQSPGLYDAIFDASDRAGIRPRVAAETDDAGSTAVIASTRGLVGFCTATRSRELYNRSYTMVRLINPTPEVRIHAVWRTDASPAVVAFLESLELAGPFEAEVPAVAM
jgi:DNA-binding transcriptional LysR family regulator